VGFRRYCETCTGRNVFVRVRGMVNGVPPATAATLKTADLIDGAGMIDKANCLGVQPRQ
jgi:hypothetical protein